MNRQFKTGDWPIGLSVTQLQHNLPISRTSIYRLIKQGTLRSVIICGRRIIPLSEVKRLITNDGQFAESDQKKESN